MSATPTPPEKEGLPTAIRLSSTLGDADASLGPLADLVGTWFGTRGWNLIAVPAVIPGNPQREGFRLLVNAYAETITFTPVGALVPNRGAQAGDMFVPALQYTATVSDLKTNQPLHVENGMWLLLKDPVTGAQTVARLTSVPHGDALLAVGTFGDVAGDFPIAPRSAVPVGAEGQPLGYLDPYLNLPAGIPFTSADVNQPLRDDLKGVKLVQTTFLDVSTDNGGGISNVPFVTRNANATKVQSTFWIESVLDADGHEFLQLQYSQQVDLRFIKQARDPTQLILWPHTSTNTLLKQ